MKYYCPNCGFEVTEAEESCPYCKNKLHKTTYIKEQCFKNVDLLFDFTVLAFLVTILLEFLACFTYLDGAFENNLVVVILVIFEALSLVLGIVAIVGMYTFLKESSKFNFLLLTAIGINALANVILGIDANYPVFVVFQSLSLVGALGGIFTSLYFKDDSKIKKIILLVAIALFFAGAVSNIFFSCDEFHKVQEIPSSVRPNFLYDYYKLMVSKSLFAPIYIFLYALYVILSFRNKSYTKTIFLGVSKPEDNQSFDISNDKMRKIIELEKLKDYGVLTKEQFEEKKTEIINKK